MNDPASPDPMPATNEAALSRAADEQYVLAADSPVMIWATDASAACTYLSPSWYKFTGQAPGAGNGDGWQDVIHPDDLAPLLRSFEHANRAHEPFRMDYRLRHKDGEYRWMIDLAAPRFGADSRFHGFVGAIVDITDRKKSEDAIRVSEANARLAILAGQLGTWDTDFIRDVRTWNARCRELLYASPGEEATREVFVRVCHAEDRERVLAAVRRSMDPAHRTLLAEEYRVIEPASGEVRWLFATGQPFFEGDRCVRFMGVLADITERKRTEIALRELTQTLEHQVAQRTRERDRQWQLSQDLMLVTEPSGIIVAVNPAWSTRLGWARDELLGKPVLRFVHPEDVVRAAEEMGKLTRGELLTRSETRMLCNDDTFRWISWAATPEENFYYGIGRDITAEKTAAAELERAQEALRQAQKMEALGQLTGGIAHDFNNLLQVILGNLETLQRHLPVELGRLRRATENATAGAARAAMLTQRLLAFSRRQPLQPKPLDVNKLVGGMSDMLRRTLGELTEVETVLTSGLWRVEADMNQLESALLNLAVNARDAMPDGGKLTLETGNAHLDDAYGTAASEVVPGQYVMISVSDTGRGMTKEVLDRAFEPFFTTKSVNEGTGLGLSQVYGFVKQSGGHIRIYSEHGEGTTVNIYLPRLATTADAQLDSESRLLPEVGTGHETILVVEDDDGVRAYTVETVRELGYRVLAARDGPSALELLRNADTNVDLLFTDVVLPAGINGQQLAAEALRHRPGMKVLFTTGYARNAIVHQGRLDPGVSLLTKPFTYTELAAKLRDVLDGV